MSSWGGGARPTRVAGGVAGYGGEGAAPPKGAAGPPDRGGHRVGGGGRHSGVKQMYAPSYATEESE